MPSVSVPCHYCGRLVHTQFDGAWHRVQGWVNKGNRGFRTEKHLDEWAHESCVDQAQRGLIGQASLDV